MNLRTAAIALNEEVRVLNVRYINTDGSKSRKTYTFIAYPDWLANEVAPGTWLFAQGRDTTVPAIVEFDSWGDITDLDLDDDEIVYKAVIGTVPGWVKLRLEFASQRIDGDARELKHLRLAGLRQQIRGQLVLPKALKSESYLAADDYDDIPF